MLGKVCGWHCRCFPNLNGIIKKDNNKKIHLHAGKKCLGIFLGRVFMSFWMMLLYDWLMRSIQISWNIFGILKTMAIHQLNIEGSVWGLQIWYLYDTVILDCFKDFGFRIMLYYYITLFLLLLSFVLQCYCCFWALVIMIFL